MATPSPSIAIGGQPHAHAYIASSSSGSSSRPLHMASSSTPSLTFNASQVPLHGDYSARGSHGHSDSKVKASSSVASSVPLWSGSWVDEDSPFFDLTTTSFPLLPRAPPSVGDDYTSREEARAHRRGAAQNLTSMLNDPAEELEDIIEQELIRPLPSSLADKNIDIPAVLQHFKYLGEDTLRHFLAHHPSAATVRANAAAAVTSPTSLSSSSSSLPLSSSSTVSSIAPSSSSSSSSSRQPHAEKVAERELAELLTRVPEVYFRADFSVAQQPFFCDPDFKVDPQLLQEQLQNYIDLVEHNLLNQVSARSHSFFSALSNIEVLHSEVGAGLRAIQRIRSKMAILQKRFVHSSFSVLKRQRRLENIKRLISTTDLLQTVVRTQSQVQQLLATSDFGAALDLIHSTRQAIRHELAGLSCLKHIDAKLQEMVLLVEKLMSSDMIHMSLHGMPDGDHRSTTFDPHLTTSEKDRLLQLIHGLYRIGRLGSLFPMYRDELNNAAKQRLSSLVSTIVDTSPDAMDDDYDAKDVTTPSSSSSSTPRLPRSQSEDNDSKVVTSSSSTIPKVTARDEAPSDGLRGVRKPNFDAASTSAPSHNRSVSMSMTASKTGSVASGTVTGGNPATAAAAAAGGDHRRTSSTAPSSGAITPPISSLQYHTDTASSDKPDSLAVKLPALSHRAFMSLLSRIHTLLLNAIQRTSLVRSTVQEGILSFADTKREWSGTLAPSEPIIRGFDELLASFCVFCHNKVSRIVETRDKAHAELELKELKELFDLIADFLVAGETLCKKTFFGRLRNTMLTQAKSFLVTFHQRHIAALAAALEAERWTRCEVSADIQTLLDSQYKKPDKATIVPAAAAAAVIPSSSPATSSTPATNVTASSSSSSTTTSTATNGDNSSDTSSVTSAASITPKVVRAWQAKNWDEAGGGSDSDDDKDHSKSRTSDNGTTNGSHTGDEKKKDDTSLSSSSSSSSSSTVLVAPKPLVARVAFITMEVNGKMVREPFPIVRSVITIIRSIELYMECAAQLPAVAPDVLNKLVELLTLFNSRTCQLLLGAGATHLGMKTITSVHLALASQCVGLVGTQIPVVRRALSHRLPKQHQPLLATLLDNVEKDYKTHQKEIYTKLVDILKGLLDKTCRDLVMAEWPKNVIDDFGPSGSEKGVEATVKSAMNSTAALHRGLSDLLSSSQRESIFRDIAAMFTMIISRYFSRLDLAKRSNARAVSANVSFILARLRALPGLDATAARELEDTFVIVAPAPSSVAS